MMTSHEPSVLAQLIVFCFHPNEELIQHFFKGDLFCCFFLPFFKFKNVNVHTDRRPPLPQKALLLKRLVSSRPFSSETLWHHSMLSCDTLGNWCVVANWTYNYLIWHRCCCCCWGCWLRRVWADQSEQTEYLRRGAFKRQELKHSVSDGGGIQSCRPGRYEFFFFFFEL